MIMHFKIKAVFFTAFFIFISVASFASDLVSYITVNDFLNGSYKEGYVRGYVYSSAPCPVCPKGAFCKPCAFQYRLTNKNNTQYLLLELPSEQVKLRELKEHFNEGDEVILYIEQGSISKFRIKYLNVNLTTGYGLIYP